MCVCVCVCLYVCACACARSHAVSRVCERIYRSCSGCVGKAREQDEIGITVCAQVCVCVYIFTCVRVCVRDIAIGE
jgi:hypothetical protein